MKNSILTGAAAALAMTIGFAGDARAQCYWTAYGYQCPAPGYSQPNFGWGIVGSGFDARPDSRRYRGLRPDAGYPGPALVGSEG